MSLVGGFHSRLLFHHLQQKVGQETGSGLDPTSKGCAFQGLSAKDGGPGTWPISCRARQPGSSVVPTKTPLKRCQAPTKTPLERKRGENQETAKDRRQLRPLSQAPTKTPEPGANQDTSARDDNCQSESPTKTPLKRKPGANQDTAGEQARRQPRHLSQAPTKTPLERKQGKNQGTTAKDRHQLRDDNCQSEAPTKTPLKRRPGANQDTSGEEARRQYKTLRKGSQVKTKGRRLPKKIANQGTTTTTAKERHQPRDDDDCQRKAPTKGRRRLPKKGANQGTTTTAKARRQPRHLWRASQMPTKTPQPDANQDTSGEEAR
ncbi:hypothetical protein NDU88_000815 [Pleurodeles waltl]|uniref:Uncharacterized protein n=1 Tax=Pleurodeles waltl TaxID=8319 RepID=A0AAV7LVT5_PLEWA|nr:hypothetical protein NDU88_000815 [Pleurodeles waltl]